MQQQDKVAGRQVLDRLMGALGIAAPYPWQVEAFEAMCAGRLPASIHVPTAAGKTALMVCWLAALIVQGRGLGVQALTLPRRCVVVVNRRVLVDAASDLALRLPEALERPDLADLRASLADLSLAGRSGEAPMTVSTLRGQRADACDWASDPSRPAIIAATPDMAGSRLLFGGYGLGRSRRATHAGLLGVDTLVVHDEAHLAPALTALLRQVEGLAAPGAVRIGRPALAVIEMSATPRGLSEGDRPVIKADPDTDPALAQRLQAVKRLRRQDGAGLADLVKQAVAAVRAGQAVLVCLNSPDDAAKAAAALLKAGLDPERIACLTGTLRGLERDRLAASPALRRLAGDGRRDEASGGAVLVATAAGEVGIDLDADLLLCDAVTLDRLMQRAGRCNRRGLGVGNIVVFPEVARPPKALAARVAVALTLLDELPACTAAGLGTTEGAREASPHALSALLAHPRYADAIEPAPMTRALTRDVIDLYALTAAPLAVPQRALYLHGVQDEDTEVRLVWRHLPSAAEKTGLAEWLEAWPVSVREQARLPAWRAEKLVLARLAAWNEARTPGLAAVIVSADGERVEPVAMGARRLSLHGGDLVLLAVEAGGLGVTGLPDALVADAAVDVSGEHTDARGYERGAVTTLALTRKVSEAQGERWFVEAEDSSALTSLTAALTTALPGWRIAWHDEPPPEANGQDWHGRLRVWPERPGVRAADDGDSAGQSRADRRLDEHLRLAGRAAARLLAVLPLEAGCAQAVQQGASDHDDGKAAPRWQAAIGRRAGEVPLAKSARPWFDTRRSAGYRHELGSVAGAPAAWRTAASAALWRHLVVAHHGWARPGFAAAALAHPGCTDAAQQAGDDFGRLHDTLGPWALAYLEGLLKAADIQAELRADTLAGDADPAEAPREAPPVGPALPEPAAACWRVAVNVRNPGEYFACLGVAALARALRPEVALALRWEPGHFVLQGVDDAVVRELLAALCRAEVVPETEAAHNAPPDAEGGDGEAKEPGWPALRLVLPDDGPVLPLHAWIGDSGRGNSEWKWSGGRTLALDITRRLLQGCAELLAAAQDVPGRLRSMPLFAQGAGLAPSNPDTARFRFDASGAWSAVEVGYSLEKENRPKSCRPWVELLAMLGVQTFAPPPAGRKAGGWACHTWTHALTPVVAMAAVRGHHPSCDRRLVLRTLLTNEGKYADALIADLTVLAPRPSAVLIC